MMNRDDFLEMVYDGVDEFFIGNEDGYSCLDSEGNPCYSNCESDSVISLIMPCDLLRSVKNVDWLGNESSDIESLIKFSYWRHPWLASFDLEQAKLLKALQDHHDNNVKNSKESYINIIEKY